MFSSHLCLRICENKPQIVREILFRCKQSTNVHIQNVLILYHCYLKLKLFTFWIYTIIYIFYRINMKMLYSSLLLNMNHNELKHSSCITCTYMPPVGLMIWLPSKLTNRIESTLYFCVPKWKFLMVLLLFKFFNHEKIKKR